MGIIFDNTNLEIDFLQSEEVLFFKNNLSPSHLCKLGSGNTARLYLPKQFCTMESLSANDKVYITHTTLQRTLPVGQYFIATVLQAGRQNLYINFPKTLINAYNPKPTHIRLTYDDKLNIWKYQLVKKEIM